MNVLAINKLVFDGSEQDFYSFSVEVKCPFCSKDIVFLADDMTPMEEIDVKSLPKSFAKQLNLRRRAGGSIFENNKGLESYAIECQCGNCGGKCIVVAGMGEVQPTRFNVFVEGVVVE